MTKKNKRYNLDSPVLNILIALVCVLGMGGSVLLFRQDLKKSVAQMEEKPVGAVYWVNNTVQRFSARHGQWDRLERYSPVYNGDIIFSAAVSAVKINFVNGEDLELSANTRVLIDYENGEVPRFELRDGELEAQSGGLNLEIPVPEDAAAEDTPDASLTRVSLNPRSGAGVKKTRDGSVFKVYQGGAAVSSGGETREAAAGNALRTGSGGVFLRDPPLMMLSPRSGTRVLRSIRGRSPVQFLWRQTGADKGARLEISGSADFTDPVGSWIVPDADSTEIELAQGTYYWKIYPLDSQEEADRGRLEIVYTGGLRAVSPADGSFYGWFGENQEIRFSWAVPEDAEAVLLEVAANPEMARPRIRQLIKRTSGGYGSFVTSSLALGQWYWRVHPVYPGGVSDGGGLSSLSDSPGQSFWRVSSVNTRVLAEEQPSPINSFTLVSPEELSVRKKSADVKEINAVNTEPGSSPRLIFPPDNYTLEAGRTPDLFFYWINPSAYNARFEISERSDFSGSLAADEEVFGSNIQGPFLKPGTYYWRVTGAGASSRPIRLVVEPALTAPVLQAPANEENLRITEGNAVGFTWERKNYANYYVFKLFVEGRPAPIAEISSLQNNAVMVYFDPRTQGRFRWTVQGFASPTETFSGRTGLIAEGRFTIGSPGSAGGAQGSLAAWTNPRITNIQTFEGEVYSPITLLSPVSGTNIPGVQALRAPLPARWRTDEPLRNIQLIVSKNTNPMDDPGAIVIDAGASSSVTLPALSEGIWYWMVRGDTYDDRGATPGDPFWINVLPIPLIPAPPALQPENDSVIGLEQLTSDKKITFLWEEAEGANAYIFTLFRRAPGEPADPPALVLSVPLDNVFSYDLDESNFPLLGHGNYLWQIEAIYRNELGAIEQRGVIEQHPFGIMIRRSSDIHTQGPGTMYGQ